MGGGGGGGGGAEDKQTKANLKGCTDTLPGKFATKTREHSNAW